MHEPRGRDIPISETRRFIIDLVHFARRVPSIPVSRVMNVADLAEPRVQHPARPSWSVLFMKAYALVAAQHAPLRRAFLSFPRMRLYEHPITIGSLAIEREFPDGPGIYVGLFRAPEEQSLGQIQEGVDWYKKTPLDQIGVFRRLVMFSHFPTPIRRLFWWSTLNVSGFKRAKRFGTFGVSSYGSLGAESLHPISPLTTTLTYGPIAADGSVTVKLIYDHRVLDGAEVARRLRDLEDALHGPVLEELKSDPAAARTLAVHPPAASVPPAPKVAVHAARERAEPAAKAAGAG